MRPSSRRRFLKNGLSGTALVTLPGFLAACGPAASGPATSMPPENPFLSWFGIDDAMLKTVMAELTARGADAADLYFQHVRRNLLVLEDGVVNRANTSIQQGVGLRVVVGEQTGFAFTEDLTLPSMRKAAETAAAIAKGAAAPAPAGFQPAAAADLYQVQVPWDDVGVDQKLPLLQLGDRIARERDPTVKKVSVTWRDEDERLLIATLDGRIVMDRRPMVTYYVGVNIERNGETQAHGSSISAREGFDAVTEARVREVVDQAIDRTDRLFDAVRPPAGEMPVVLAAGASGILLHEAIGHGMEADFNRKGVSIYSDMLGKKVAEPFVTITDEATLPNRRGALNVDDEGNPTGKTTLVEDGILRSYLHDGISARQYGVAPTGSGRRESYKHPPMPRMSCTTMESGPHTRDEIIAAVDHGIVAETFTNGQVQIGAGDYTFYVKNGWLIDGGKITAPIRDINIIGNGPESLQRITMAADDAVFDSSSWTCGKAGQRVPVSQGIPTVLVSKMTVGGKNA